MEIIKTKGGIIIPDEEIERKIEEYASAIANSVSNFKETSTYYFSVMLSVWLEFKRISG